MLNRLLPFTILSLMAAAVWAQTPQAVTFETGGQLGNSNTAFMACQDQYAGTISFANFIGQSNDIDLDTIYFCFNDQIDIVHNGDEDLTGDPNTFTVPGITYGFFDCPPTIFGPNLMAILGDPCLTDNPPPPNGIWVTAGGDFSGDITFSNTGSLQNTYNGGDPILLWFAPLTVDNFAIKQYEVDPATNEVGPCVNLNVDEAFAVVYLNEVEISNFGILGSTSGCGGGFEISGGLPEFDGSDYPDISISLVGNPGVTGIVASNPVGHGGTVEFSVPTPGFYNIVVEDGKSCPATFIADMSSCVSVSQSAESITAAPGDTVCVDITNEGGFDDIVSMQYAMTWNSAVLQFSHIQNTTPNLPSFDPTIGVNFNVNNDTLIVAWGSFGGIGSSLPPGELMFQVCFEVIGIDGDCTPLEYTIPSGSTTEFVNENGAILGFNGIDGEVCVSNSALVVDFTQDSVNCSGGMDGSFTVTVSGGTAPYEVTWQPMGGGPVGGPGVINIDGGSFTANGLAAGTYSVTVTDSQTGTPLTSVETVEVLGPPVLAIIFSENPGPCNGDPGSITATLILDSNVVISPLVDYDFLWSTMETGTSIGGLMSGSYSLTVTETATGCSIENSTFLFQNPPLSMIVTYDTATCSGVADGTISVVVSGGVPDINGDYTIELPTAGTGANVTGTMANIQGLIAGEYPIIITDDNGCTLEDVLVLPAIKTLSINAQITPILCDSACSGGIFITGLTDGGTPGLPFNFDWFGNPPPPPPIFTSNTQSQLANLCEGTYWVVMEDTEGCEVVDTFVLVEPEPLNLSLVGVENETCSPGMDGSVTIEVSGGEWPYTYMWNSNPSTDSIATGLAAGIYTVTVEDANGCVDTLSATVTVPPPPQILNFPNDTLDCINSTDGSLTVTTTPDVISYDWSNGDVTQTIFNLTPGEYIVTVSTDENCTATDTAYVVAPTILELDSFNLEPPQCPGSSGGTIQPFFSGATPPYSFEWSTGWPFQVIGQIPAGVYTVTVTDANGCQPPLIETFTLEDPPSIVVDFSNIDSTSCALGGNCDGGATASAMYSDGNTGTFNFTWLPSGEFDANVMVSTATMLCPGMDSVIVSDNICNDTFIVEIPSPPMLFTTGETENVSCNGDTDGTAIVTPGGGSPPFTIVWPNGEMDFEITDLAPGPYVATVTDSEGCSFTHIATIGEPEPLAISLNAFETMQVSCNGYEDGIISIIPEGGNDINGPGTTYVWENGIAGTSSRVATELAAGTYSVTVVDVKGCEAVFTHTVEEPPPIFFRVAEFDPIRCFGERAFITVDSIWGGAPSVYQFSINNSPGAPVGLELRVFSGDVTVEVFDVANTTCKVDTTFFVGQPDELQIQMPDIVEIELGDSTTQLIPNIVPPIPIDSFQWQPAAGLSCSDCKNPVVNVTNNQTYTLTIWDINGCVASKEVLIDIDKNRNVFIPNIFSPDGNGVNDKFQVFTGPGVERINFVRVYDRWGELVFEEPGAPLTPSPDGTPGWDGRLDGEKMNPAVFLYLIEVEFIDGQILLYRGDVSLIR